MRAEARADELRETVGLLVRLRARERDRDPPVGLTEETLGVVERVLPGSLLQPVPSDASQRVGDSVLGVEVGEREAALVAEPALVDLGVVAGEDSLDLALAL